LPHDRQVQRFTIGVVIAFLPAAFFGVLLHDLITHVFFESLTLICTALLVGGVILLILDRVALKPRHTDIMQFPIRLAFGIGLFQCLALIPGVSRSGATIGGALVLGADKRAAAEYSFFLAMPTMAGAVGFVVAFLAALVVVRSVLGFISRRGFAPFAWWRIAVGGIGLIWIFLTPPAPGTATVEASGGGALAIELSARSVAPEIGRENGFEARRLDAEASERASLGGSRGGDDVVDLQLAQLVGRDQRVRQILQH
jgi:undecaprenyl-diphosphatase